MANFKDVVQKAFYLGVGLAGYAAQKAEVTLQELRIQGQKLADEMVARGEMTTEEARKFVDNLVKEAQQETVDQPKGNQGNEPRRIEIVSEDEEPNPKDSEQDHIDQLRQQVHSLQEELRRLKK